MKKTIILATVILSILLLHTTTVRAEEKIALVSLQMALNQVNDGKKAKDGLKKEYDAKKKQIDAMKADLEKMSQELEKQQMVLSADALNEKRKELQTKFMDLQNKAATFEKELKTKESDSAQKILTSLRDIVIKLSQQEGYTLVIENSSDTVLYSKGSKDITNDVIAAYNKK